MYLHLVVSYLDTVIKRTLAVSCLPNQLYAVAQKRCAQPNLGVPCYYKMHHTVFTAINIYKF